MLTSESRITKLNMPNTPITTDGDNPELLTTTASASQFTSQPQFKEHILGAISNASGPQVLVFTGVEVSWGLTIFEDLNEVDDGLPSR
jgi:hypothetical protein